MKADHIKVRAARTPRERLPFAEKNPELFKFRCFISIIIIRLMVQSGYKFRTGLASNYIVYRGLQINYFRIQKKGPFLSECVEICYKIKSFSQKQQTLSDKFNRNVIRPAFRRRPDRIRTTGPGVIRRRTGTSTSFPTRLPGRSFPHSSRYVFPTRPGKSRYPPAEGMRQQNMAMCRVTHCHIHEIARRSRSCLLSYSRAPPKDMPAGQ